MKTGLACCASSHAYEFEYLSEAKLKGGCRTNCFTSAIELKVGDAVVIEKIGRGIFLGRITDIYDCDCNTDYIYVGKAGETVTTYIDALDKEKRKEELRAQMEAKFKEIDKERKFEYYATLEGWHAAQAAMHESFGALYKEYKELQA